MACRARPRSRRMSLVAGSIARHAPSGSVALRPSSRGASSSWMIADDDRLLDVRVAGVDLRDQAVGGVQPGHDRAPVVHAVGTAGEPPPQRRPQRDRLDAIDDERAAVEGPRARPVDAAGAVNARRSPWRPRRCLRPTAGPRPRAAGVYGIGRSSGRLTPARRAGPGDAADGQLAHDRGAPAGRVDLLLGDDQAAGLLDRGADRRQVERAQPAQVDDLGVDAVRGELLGGGQRSLHHEQRGHDRDVAALAHDVGLADLGDLAAVDRALAAVQALVLVEDRSGSWSSIAARSRLYAEPGERRGHDAQARAGA